jgi:F-type H+-transporting ATPase subunit b
MNINVTMFAQAVVFAAFIWFTIRFIWPPLLTAIEARQKSIADGLAAADQGRQALEASTRQADVEMTLARERAAGLVTQASNREKAAAKAEIEQEVLRAKEALREQVAALAIAGAEKILRREINAQAHADLLNQLKQELK